MYERSCPIDYERVLISDTNSYKKLASRALEEQTIISTISQSLNLNEDPQEKS